MIQDTNENSSSVWATFRSSDNWSTDRRPRLIINTVTIPTATPTAPTPTASPTPTPTPTPLPTATPEPTPTQLIDVDLKVNTYMSTSLTTIEGYLDTANTAFISTFGVEFDLGSSGRFSTLNQRDGCQNDDDEECDDSCGAISSGESLHHKSADHFLTLEESTTNRVIRFVDFQICQYTYFPENHYAINGCTDGINYSNAIVTLCAPYVLRTTEHELSHLIGAHDFVCISGELCVMDYNSIIDGAWCTQCTSDINNFLN